MAEQVPMLPRELCEDLCSLNPGAERLAFSLEVEMTKEGDIVSRWMGKTAMQSCCKMDYDTAQVRQTHLPATDKRREKHTSSLGNTHSLNHS